MSPSLRTTWRRRVLRTRAVTDGTRVVLLALADDMREDGYVSVPRKVLAARLDRAERRIQQRIADARDAGLLAVIRPGYRGHTAEYRALLSPEKGRRFLAPINRPDSVTLSPHEWVPPGGPTTTRDHP